MKTALGIIILLIVGVLAVDANYKYGKYGQFMDGCIEQVRVEARSVNNTVTWSEAHTICYYRFDFN